MDKTFTITRIVCFTLFLFFSLNSCTLTDPPAELEAPLTEEPVPETQGGHGGSLYPCMVGDMHHFPLTEDAAPDADCPPLKITTIVRISTGPWSSIRPLLL